MDMRRWLFALMCAFLTEQEADWLLMWMRYRLMPRVWCLVQAPVTIGAAP